MRKHNPTTFTLALLASVALGLCLLHAYKTHNVLGIALTRDFKDFIDIVGMVWLLLTSLYVGQGLLAIIIRHFVNIVAVPSAAVLNANTRFTGVKHRIRDRITERLI